MENKFTPELIEKAKSAKTPEEADGSCQGKRHGADRGERKGVF